MKKLRSILAVVVRIVLILIPLLVSLWLTWPDNTPVMSILASIGVEFIVLLIIALFGAIIEQVRRDTRAEYENIN